MWRQYGEGLWTLDHPSKALSMPLGIRMTVVRLQDGGLWLHSPVPMTGADQRELEALGAVRYIVAPNLFHHLHAQAAKERFPQAKLLGAPGLPQKRNRLDFDGVLGSAPESGYAADLDQLLVAGMPRLNEVVFLHRASRTLIVTDFLFNVPNAAGPWMWLYFNLAAKLGEPCQTLIFKMVVKDKAAYRATLQTLRGWDFDRIVLSHGQMVPSGGKAALQRAISWAGA
jgi:hypothetical protein